MVLSRYMHPQKRPPAAVAVAEFDEKLGITTTVYPNNKCNFVQVGSESEAWYLAALLNSELALSGIARFVSSTTIAPSALERLPVPLFDRECADHRNLAVAAEKWVAEPTEENGSRLRALTAEVWSRAV
jgi:hypothetical protein